MTQTDLLGFKYRYEPAAPGTRTILLLHGTGADENDLIPIGRFLDAEANLLSPRGKVLENGAPRFFRRFAEGRLDIEDLKTRTHELVEFIESATAQFGFDSSRLIAAGYSNGANIAVSTLLLLPSVLKAAVLLRPMNPFEPDDKPDLNGVPVYIASGQSDMLIDSREPEALARMLKGFGADVTLSWNPGGHPLQPEELEAVRSWLQQHS